MTRDRQQDASLSVGDFNWTPRVVQVWQSWECGRYLAFKTNFYGPWHLSDDGGKTAIFTDEYLQEVMARAQAIEARRAAGTSSACESAVGETDASDAALLADICDNMAEVLKPLPGSIAESLAQIERHRASLPPEERARIEREEIQAQRESWGRAMAPCEHGDPDWETCPQCRGEEALLSKHQFHRDGEEPNKTSPENK